MDFAIGELARRSGVKVPTVRYYEGIGLLPPPPRSEGGQRRYGPAEAARLGFIRHARELGFELDVIRELLDLSGRPDRPCAEVDAIARRHVAAVERRIGQLTALRDELRRSVDACGHGQVRECRVLETLADHRRCEADHGRPTPFGLSG